MSNSLSKNKEVPKSDNGNPGYVGNGGLGLPETPEGSMSTSNEDNRNDTAKPDGNVTIVKDHVESVKKETKKKYSDDSSDDTTNAGARPCFINFLGGKTVIPKPIDVMHAENKILSLYKMCRLFLGINRDTVSAFSSYSKIKAYYHKFQSTGSSERQFSVSHIDDGDEVTIYLKTACHFYTSKTCPVPEKKNVRDEHDELSTPTVLKSSGRGLKGRKKSRKKSKISVDWKNFDDKTPKHLGKQLVEKKTGYEFGIQYHFREYFWEKEYNEIVSKSLDLSLSENKNLVPLKKPVAEGEGKGSRGSDTEEYSKSDKK